MTWRKLYPERRLWFCVLDTDTRRQS